MSEPIRRLRAAAAVAAALAVCAIPSPATATGWLTSQGPAVTASGPVTAAAYASQTRVLGSARTPVRLSAAGQSKLASLLDGSPATTATGSTTAASTPTGNCLTSPGTQSVTTSEIETPLGPVTTVPAPDGRLLRLYDSGDVALVSADGSTVWDREPHSFWADLPVTVTAVAGRAGVCWTSPWIAVGETQVVPDLTSGTPYAVGTVSGETDQVVAVAHVVSMGNESGTVTPLPAGKQAYQTSVVSLLDGRTGATLWSAAYPGTIMQLAFAGGRLLAADAAGPVLNDQWATDPGGPAGTVSRLDAWAFSPAPAGRLTGARSWTYTMHSPWALWLGLRPAGPATVAVAWSDTPLGLTNQPDGHVLLLDDASGQVRWNVPTGGFPRSLAFDPVRRQVVVLEENDPALGVGYAVAGLRLGNGGTAEKIIRTNALPFDNLQVGDITAGNAPDWAVTELDYVPIPGFPGYLAPLVTQASVFVPGQAAPAWQAQVGSEITPAGQLTSQPFYLDSPGLAIGQGARGPELIVASSASGQIVTSPQYPLIADDGSNPYSDLRALSGSDGRLLWDHTGGDEVTAHSLVLTSYDGQPSVASINMEQDLRFFSITTGAPLRTAGMFAGQMWTAAGVPAASGQPGELIVGGVSGTVFALDSSRLNDNPRILWRADLGAPVHQIRLVRLGSTGQPALIVAATTKLAVLGMDGAVRYQDSFPPGQAVLSFTTGPIAPGGATAIVVPTNALTAFDGATGKQLWRYEPAGGQAVLSDAVISAKGTVTAQYAAPPPAGADGSPQGPPQDQTAFGVHGTTGALAWSVPFAPPQGDSSTPYLDNGVSSGPDGVTFTWELADSSGGFGFNWSQEQIDVRDPDTGTLVYSQQTPAGTLESHNAYASVPGSGLADCDTGNLVAVGKAGLTPQGTSCGDIAVAAAGSGSDIVLASVAFLGPQYGQQPGLYAAPADYLTAGGTLTPLPNPLNFLITGVVPVDLSGTGTDDVVGLGFDVSALWDLSYGVLWSGGDLGYSDTPIAVWLGEYSSDPSHPAGIEVSSLPGQ